MFLSKEQSAIHELYLQSAATHISSKKYVAKMKECIALINSGKDHTEAYAELPKLKLALDKDNEIFDKKLSIVTRIKNGERL